MSFSGLPFLAATVLAATVGLPSAVLPARRDPSALLREARRSLREEGDDSLLKSLGKRSSLWRARVALSRAGAGERSGPPAGPTLGLPSIDEWLALRNDPKVDAETLARFASTLPFGPVAIEAIGEASGHLRTVSERRLVHAIAVRLLAARPYGPRAATVLLMARLRAAGDPAERRATMAELVSAAPDALERDPFLFGAEETRLFRAAALQAPLSTRIVRAKAILALHPDESAALVLRGKGGATAEDSLAAADLLLATGRFRECEQALASLERCEEAAAAEGARALSAAAALQRLSRGDRPRGRRKLRKPLGDPITKADFERLNRNAEILLARGLRPWVRRRLLIELLRASREADRPDVVRAAGLRLIELDPGGSAGSEELFQAAFSAYRSSDPELVGVAARAFAEISSSYQNVSVRRRAIYWKAKALQKRGDPSARALFASLLPGTSSDVYGRWSADSLGVDPGTALPVFDGEALMVEDGPAAASREYLAAGLDTLAELAAESEGSLDRLFAARIASERGDYRRATSILKGLRPALGTPEEGGVPLDERELFYPLTHLIVLKAEGRRTGLSPALLCGLIRQESLFQAQVVSPAGAVGLMQVMPTTGKLLRRREGGHGRPNLSLPDENIRLGSQFFGRLLKMFDGDVVAALAAYNAGPSRAARWKRENADLPPDEWVEAIPFPETREYVKRVLFYSGAYAALYGLPDPPGPSRLITGDEGIKPAAAGPVGSSRPSGGK